jgi:hypothetical protein
MHKEMALEKREQKGLERFKRFQNMMKKFPGTKCGISWFISLLKACKRNEDK